MKSIKFLILIILFFPSSLFAVDNSFVIDSRKNTVDIFIANDESISVKRAAIDLQSDIKKITGYLPNIINKLNNNKKNVIIVGTIGNKSIENIIRNTKQSKTLLKGKYESFLMRPLSDNKLLIVGSDNLGTIYGIYELSKKIGIDPLYWWCDMPIKRQKKVVLNNCTEMPQQPSVRYRGIFINDEEAMIKWSGNTSVDKTKGALSPETYKRIFELMLRLKVNTIWPSMMEAGTYFFKIKDEHGVPINPKNATDYGLYIGTSHCENMARNNYAEWYDWASKHKDLFDMNLNTRGELEFDYTVNPKAIETYWRERIQESKNFNMIYTMGIRGVHDSPFMCRLLPNPTLKNRVALLQKVINLQRKMIKEVFGREDAVPQIFVPYEETGELYNGETKDLKQRCEGLKLPDDIIVVSTEDNYGYTRQLPQLKELTRRGGCGIYYHLAYQGSPSPYNWLTSMPYPIMQQELKKLYESGCKKFWIVNVGDLKPAEMGLKLFTKMAYDSPKYLYEPTENYIKYQLKNTFGLSKNKTEEATKIVEHFQCLANSNKPEFMSSFWSIYFKKPSYVRFFSSFDFGDEAQQKINEYIALEKSAKKIYDGLSKEKQPAFWHMVYYPIRAARGMCEKSYYYHKNILYNQQGRFSSVNGYKNLSLRAAADIDKDLNYYNNVFMDGKWKGIIDPYAHYNYTERVFDIANIPEKFIYDQKYKPESKDCIGSVCEGQVKGDEKVQLRFSSYEDNRRFIDIFNRGVNLQNWSVTPSDNWIKINKRKGIVQDEERLWVSIDWNKTPKGECNGIITVSDKNGIVKSYDVSAMNFDLTIPEKCYVEGCGYVTIETEKYSVINTGKNNEKWNEVKNYGYCNSSMVVNGKNKCENPFDGATLSYNIYFNSTGEFTGYVYRIPTLNEGKEKSCCLGVGLDNVTPQVLFGVRAKNSKMYTTLNNGIKESRSWESNVATQMEKIPFVIKVNKKGIYTLKLYSMDNHIAVDRIVIATDKQAEDALKRSIIGPHISYNNFTSKYKKIIPSGLPTFSSSESEVCDYPKQTPLTYVKFAFSRYGNPAVWGFTPISDMNIYNPQTNLYGWDKNTVVNVKPGHNESTRIIPHWKRDNNNGTKPTTFYVSMLEGNYEMTIYSGQIRYYGYGGAVFDVNMNLYANGKELMKNELFKIDFPSSRTYNINVGSDNLLKLDFSGNWSVSAIELYRK